MSTPPQSGNNPSLLHVVGCLREGMSQGAGSGASHPYTIELDWKGTMTELADRAASKRFEMVFDGVTAYVTYAGHSDRLTLVRTEVPKALSGPGVGSSFPTGGLENVRKRGLHVAVECEFLPALTKRHPGFAELVVEPDDAP